MYENGKISMKLFLLCVMSSIGIGASVSSDFAREVAQGIFFENKHLHGKNEFNVSHVETLNDEGRELIHIFHLSPKGFIMVPADDQAIPNLAFGFEHSFVSNDMPSNLNALMESYERELLHFMRNQGESSFEIKALWEGYLDESIRMDHSRDVSPLIDAEFDQGGSWNNGIQAGIGFNGPVGCVAVSMCQVMHYWGYPEQGFGSNYYTEND